MLIVCGFVCMDSLFFLVFDFRNFFRRCRHNPQSAFTHVVEQGVKLPALCTLSVCLVWEKEMIHGYVVTGDKLIENLQTWLLPFVLNICKVARGNVHVIAYLFAALISVCPCRFDGFTKSPEVVKWYKSFCHNCSPHYILQFIFSSWICLHSSYY